MLLDLAQLDIPTQPESFFDRPAPLVLEVGFGDGWYLAHLASTHPEWNLLGAEVSMGSVTRAFKRLHRENLTNARLYRGHARFVVRNLIPPRALHRVYVNFPDPWPKKRHHNKRLLQSPFFRLLSTRLEEGGALLFTSDHAEYFQTALDAAQSTGLYTIERKAPPAATLETKYARKWRAQDIPIQHAVFTKIAEADESFGPNVETTETMHHAILDGTLPSFDRFDKQVHVFKGGHVIVLEAFRAVNENGLVFLARIEEKDLTQEVLIEARPANKKGDLTFLGIKPFSQPLGTRGTREAIRVIAAWLEEQGMQTVERFH